MIKHKQVIQAWLDGAEIGYYRNGDWMPMPDNDSGTNPIRRTDLEWRIKPELKQVDYQALIDAKMIVGFTDDSDCESSNYGVSRLTKIHSSGVFIDDLGWTWNKVMFEDNLKQVTTTDTIYNLWKAGFSVEVEGSYDCAKLKDDLYIVVLTGVREGYAL